MKYFVTVDGAEYEVVVDGDEVRLGKDVVRARLEEIPGSATRLLRIGTHTYRILARRLRRGDYTLSVNGVRSNAEAVDERARAIRLMAGASKASAGPTHLAAPMPGLIVRVAVREGDLVQAGQGLVVMEAMKMENELRASAPGAVRRLLVSPGSAVEKGALLIELEPQP